MRRADGNICASASASQQIPGVSGTFNLNFQAFRGPKSFSRTFQESWESATVICLRYAAWTCINSKRHVSVICGGFRKSINMSKDHEMPHDNCAEKTFNGCEVSDDDVQNEGKQRVAVFTVGYPGVSSFLMTRMVAGGRPSPGKIWVQRVRQPSENSRAVHISHHNSRQHWKNTKNMSGISQASVHRAVVVLVTAPYKTR